MDTLLHFFNQHIEQIMITIICVIVCVALRMIICSIVTQFGKKSDFSNARIKLVTKYIDWFIIIIAGVLIIGIWGVESKQAFLVISSVFTVIGVAMFAQWSILSNITAGIILFFSFPFKIGNRIRILDKENPLEAEIMDIKSFYTLLKTDEGEKISYPNNLLFQKGVAIVPPKKVDNEDVFFD